MPDIGVQGAAESHVDQLVPTTDTQHWQVTLVSSENVSLFESISAPIVKLVQ